MSISLLFPIVLYMPLAGLQQIFRSAASWLALDLKVCYQTHEKICCGYSVEEPHREEYKLFVKKIIKVLFKNFKML